MAKYEIVQNDVIEWAKSYTGEKFHAMLTDCPYHLTSITKRFGRADSAPAKGDVYRRASAGFMNQVWDGGGISFDPATWAALSQHLYPGAFIMAFASSRGWHRMAVAMEDSGLILHPTLWNYWSYLSGFPKATRIKGDGAAVFSGHRYGLQALKPALEPIIVAQVPYGQRPVENIVATGAGALNIDGGRIGTGAKKWDNPRGGIWTTDSGATGELIDNPLGRWPANFVLSHSPLDNGTCHPDCAVKLFDEQAGEITTGGPAKGRDHIDRFWTGKKGIADNPETYNGGDSGPASRMFFQAGWQYEVAEQLANAEPVRYEPKSSRAERDAGLEGFERKATKWQREEAGVLAQGKNPKTGERSGNLITPALNSHPTVKPLSLAIYLSRLLAPPPAYAPRRILIPFSGSGSEIIGAILSGGFEEIIGIEAEANYVKIAEARCSWWSQWPGWGQTDVDAILKADEENKQQLSFL